MKRRIFTAALSLCLALGFFPNTALAEGLMCEVGGECDHAATINEAHYATLNDAVEDAQSGDTIILRKDISGMKTEDIVTIPEDLEIVLDMAGHSITVDENFEGRPIVNNGTLTVTGEGVIDSSASENDGYGAINNKGTLTIENGTYRGATYAGGASIRNTGENAELFIEDGTFEKATCAIFNEGTVTIDDGLFIGTTCVGCDGSMWSYTIRNYTTESNMVINGGTFIGTQGAVSASVGRLEINGGNFKTVPCENNHVQSVFYALYAAGEVGEVECVINGGTFETEGKYAAVLVGNDNTGGDGGINAQATAYINGGEFKAPEGVPALIGAEKTGDPIITGGTYTSDVSKYLDVSSKYEENSDGTYTATPLTAEDEDVAAERGGKYYKTLYDAINAADGGEITLIRDVEEDVVIPEDAEITIDLNGKTLTNVSDHTITNKGKLTITDGIGTGAVDNIIHAKAALYNAVGAEAKLEGGMFTRSMENGINSNDNGGNSFYTIQNQGTMTIEDGVTVTQGEDRAGRYSSMVANGWISGKQKPIDAPNAQMIINGGDFIGGLNTIKNDDYGDIVINGGRFKNSSQAAIMNWNIAEINGGKFEADKNVIVNGYDNDTMDQGKLKITDGEFISGEGYEVIQQNGGSIGEVIIEGGDFEAGGKDTDVINSTAGKILISGGRFSKEPLEEYLDTDYRTVITSSGEYMVVPSNSRFITIIEPDDTFTEVPAVILGDDGAVKGVEEAEKVGESFSVPRNNTLNNWKYSGWTFTAEKDGIIVTYGTEKELTQDLADWMTKKLEQGYSLTMDSKTPGIYTITTGGGGSSSGGSGSGGSSVKKYSITFNKPENGALTVSPENAVKGSTVTITVDPESGYELGELNVTDNNGDIIKLTDNGDGVFTFIMPESKVKVEAAFIKIENITEILFTDVYEDAYYFDAVQWAAANGITGGISADKFGPDEPCTRAQLVTFLWRAAGSPVPGISGTSFTDIDEDSYYYNAVLWATERGIVAGTSDTTFGPDDIVTRGQTVAFLYRNAGCPEAEDSNLFVDVEEGAYYTDAVKWAIANGITAGTSDTTFSPNDVCTRAQIVTFMYKAFN